MKLKVVEIAGKQYPIHFGMAALLEIAETTGIDPDNLLSSLQIRSAKDRLNLAYIGMKEGCRIAEKDAPSTFLKFCDLLDQNPDALEEIVGLYYLQTFGKKVDALIEEAEKIEDEGVKEAVDNIKNVWPILTQKASTLVSDDYTK